MRHLKIRFFIFSSLCICSIWSCEKDNFTDPDNPKYNTQTEKIILHMETTFQTIDHFGASDAWSAEWVGRWPDASKDPIAKLLFSTETDAQGNPEGIGLTMWRFNIGEGAAEQSDSGYLPNVWERETECFLNQDGTYNWTKQVGSRWFLEKARAYGVPKFTAWTNSPPYFMTDNTYTFRTDGVEGYNLPEANYEAFATHLATVVKHFRDEGYNFESLSPFNEPQYNWSFEIGQASQAGSKAFNSEIAIITRSIDEKFTDLNVNARIMIPEAGQLKYLYEGSGNTVNQITDFFMPSSPNYIGDLPHISKNIAGHSYFSNQTATESVGQRNALRKKLNSMGADLTFWQTEYSLLGGAYLQGRDATTLMPMDYALWIARIIHTDLVHGNATGWSFWTAMNNSTYGDHPNRFNLILWKPNTNNPAQTDGTYQVIKNLWAYGNFSRFIKPGMVRFDVVDPAYDDPITAIDNFLISGYQSNTANEIVLVCINNSDKSRTVEFANYGDGFEVENNVFDMYLTSSDSDLKRSTVQYDALIVPPKSIVTLTAKIKK